MLSQRIGLKPSSMSREYTGKMISTVARLNFYIRVDFYGEEGRVKLLKGGMKRERKVA